MPSELKVRSVPYTGWSQYEYQSVKYISGKWRCDAVVTDPKIPATPYDQRYESVERTWVRSSPWPVPAGQFKVVNPYSVTRVFISYPPCSWDRTVVESGSTCYSRTDNMGYSPTGGACNPAPPALDTARTNWVNSRAMLNFLLRVKDQKSQIAVSLAESRQTLDMLSKAARDIVGIRKNWLRKQPRSTRKDERKLHSSWLEYRYGWMPLYYDAYGIAKHLSTLDTQETFAVTANAKWESDVTEVLSWNNATWKGSYRSRNAHRYVAKVGGFITITHRTHRELVRAGLTNPLELAWELLPYSFVVDWFIKVGDYVEGMTALSGVEAHHCWASLETIRVNNKSPLKTTYPTNLTIRHHPDYAHKHSQYDRWPVIPSLGNVSLSSLVDLDLSKQTWKRWVDAGALLRAAFRER